MTVAIKTKWWTNRKKNEITNREGNKNRSEQRKKIWKKNEGDRKKKLMERSSEVRKELKEIEGREQVEICKK